MIYLFDEIWKDIPQYEGIYQASNYGNIRTVEGKTTFTNKHGIRYWKSRVLKGRGNNRVTGKRVSLWKNGKKKEFLVARLVAITFLGDPPKNYTVNHKDGNRLNNRLDNLEWLSLEDNIRHGFKTGLYYRLQKSIAVKMRDKLIKFNSLADLDAYLKRGHGYTSGRIKKGYKTVIDSVGNQFEYVLLE